VAPEGAGPVRRVVGRNANSSIGERTVSPKHYLVHDKLLVRFLALLAVVAVVFVAGWAVAYAFLPEGVLRGRTGAAALAGSDLAGGSVWLEWLRIFGINLAVTFLLMVPANLLRTKRDYPLGYFSVIAIVTVAAVTLGTNSFTLPMATRTPPSLAVFGSTGVYELAAYVLAVTATVSIARWRTVRWWGRDSTEKVVLRRDRSTIFERNLGVVLSIVLLAAASGWEAYRVSLAVVS
jgi:hypothetical protein